MDEALEQYNSLLASGDLLDLFPGLKGNWEQDKKVFVAQYKDNQEILNDDLNIEDDDESIDPYGFDNIYN